MSLLGIDIGTSGCKAGAFTVTGHCLGIAYREYPTLQVKPGQAELDSRIVIQRLKDAIAEVVSHTGGDLVTALCISAMGEAMTPVDENREIIGNSILSVDLRGAEHITRIEEDLGQEAFYAINPNILAPNYSLPKLLWLRENNPAEFQGAWKYLLWCDLVSCLFGGEPITSYSHANRTLLFDLYKEDWSEPLLAWSGIPKDKLPTVAPSGTITGTVASQIARELGLPDKVKIILGGHDQCCNALGAGVISGGKAVCGIGTIECIAPVYDQVPPTADMLATRLNVEHHVLPGLYMSFIYNQSGVLMKWFRDTFAQADKKLLGADIDIYETLLAEMPEAPTGLLTLPHFEITGAPDFISNSAGVIAGLHTNTPRGAILKGLIEGATYYFLDSLNALNRLGIDTSEFIATGGGAKSDRLLQIKADIFGAPFVRLRHTECGIAGAAMLAGMATGVYHSAQEATDQFVFREKSFEPDMEKNRRYTDIYSRYRRLYPALKDILTEINLNEHSG